MQKYEATFVANNFGERFCGLIFKKTPSRLIIPYCRAIHTFWMKTPIDLFWLNSEYKVIEINRKVKSRRIKFCLQATHVLEAPSNENLSISLNEKVHSNRLNENIAQDESGQALVEAAFVLPLMLVLVFGFVQLGLAIHELQKLTHTANYASEVGSLTNDNLKITGAVASFYSDDEVSVAIESYRFSDNSLIADTDRRYGDVVKIQLSHEFSIQIPFITVNVLDLTSESSARVLCQNNFSPHICS